MRKIYIFLSLIAMVMVSCTNDTDSFLDQVTEQSESSFQARSAGDGKYDLLGFGYDITGAYLKQTSIKDKVIDVDRFVADNPNRFYNHFLGSTTSRVYGGDNFYSYLKDVQKQSGITVGGWWKMDSAEEKSTFSGEANFDNKSTYSYSSRYSFARAEFVRKYRQYAIHETVNAFPDYLVDTFKKDLANLSPDELVDRYGTHVLLDIEVGGMQTAFLRSTILNETSTTIKNISAKAALFLNFEKFGINLGGSGSSTTTETYVKNNNSWDFTLETIGGGTNGYKISFTSKQPDPSHSIDLGAWIQSIDDNHANLVGINWKFTYPLYDFITDPTKKAQIKAAVDKYIKDSALDMIKTTSLHRYWNGKYLMFYPTCVYGESRMTSDWKYEGIIGSCLKESQPNTYALHRYWNSRYNMFYLTNTYGESGMTSDWKYEGIIGYAYKTQQEGTVPLYRYWNQKYTMFYFTSTKGETRMTRDWQYHGIVGYIYTSDLPCVDTDKYPNITPFDSHSY